MWREYALRCQINSKLTSKLCNLSSRFFRCYCNQNVIVVVYWQISDCQTFDCAKIDFCCKRCALQSRICNVKFAIAFDAIQKVVNLLARGVRIVKAHQAITKIFQIVMCNLRWCLCLVTYSSTLQTQISRVQKVKNLPETVFNFAFFKLKV